MSKFSNTLDNILGIVAQSTRALQKEAESIINGFDFDKALDDLIEKQNELINQGKKLLNDFGEFVSDIQQKVKTYDFFVNYDKERDLEPIVEYGEDGSISVTVKSKDETCTERVERKFPIFVDSEHVKQHYDSDAKRLYFTVGIGEPTPKEEEEKKDDPEPKEENADVDPTPKQTTENVERIRKAASRIFGESRE